MPTQEQRIMKLKHYLSLALCLPAAAFAADADIESQQREIQKNMQEITTQMLNTVNSLSAGINQTLPQINNALSNIMQNIVQEMSPVMLAIEKNKELMQADEDMAKLMTQSLPARYSENITYSINPSLNELALKADLNRNGSNIKFDIRRNIASVLYHKDLMEKLASGQALQENVAAPDGQTFPLNRFNIRRINGNDFLFYDNDREQESVVLGNFGSQIALRVQTNGPKHNELAEDFLLSLNENRIKKSAGIVKPEETVDDIQAAIDEELKQYDTPGKMIKLFPTTK